MSNSNVTEILVNSLPLSLRNSEIFQCPKNFPLDAIDKHLRKKQLKYPFHMLQKSAFWDISLNLWLHLLYTILSLESLKYISKHVANWLTQFYTKESSLQKYFLSRVILCFQLWLNLYFNHDAHALQDNLNKILRHYLNFHSSFKKFRVKYSWKLSSHF